MKLRSRGVEHETIWLERLLFKQDSGANLSLCCAQLPSDGEC